MGIQLATCELNVFPGVMSSGQKCCRDHMIQRAVAGDRFSPIAAVYMQGLFVRQRAVMVGSRHIRAAQAATR